MQDLDLTADYLDVRDLISRYEELEDTRDEIETEWDDNEDNAGLDFANYVRTDVRWGDDEEDEFQTLRKTLEALAGYGGDAQWRGYWYPVTLIRDDYFVDYTQDLVVDCGYISKDFPHWIAIDWEQTAKAVQEDYALITIGEFDYWYR